MPCTNSEPIPSGLFNAETLFWRHELLHRTTLKVYPTHINLYKDERNQQEAQFIKTTLEQQHFAGPAERAAFVHAGFATANQLEQDWYECVNTANHQPRHNMLYQRARASIDKISHLT